MVGTICKWEVLAHPAVTIQCFGWTVFFRAVFAGSGQTFLSLLSDSRTFEQPARPAPELIGECVGLELRAMQFYRSLAVQFARHEPACEFFHHLADQEQAHAALLELCRAAAARGRWQEACVARLQGSVPRTQSRLLEAEALLGHRASLAEALAMVIRLESSQINALFAGVVEATDARLARKFAAFGNAVRDHLGYIAERIPVLEPTLAESCRQLELPAG